VRRRHIARTKAWPSRLSFFYGRFVAYEETSYYHVKIKGKEIEDAVWYYRYPTAESALVAGRLCFYNEKVDVFVDGVKEER